MSHQSRPAIPLPRKLLTGGGHHPLVAEAFLLGQPPGRPTAGLVARLEPAA